MNIDDIMNEDIEGTLTGSTVERIRLPEEERKKPSSDDYDEEYDDYEEADAEEPGEEPEADAEEYDSEADGESDAESDDEEEDGETTEGEAEERKESVAKSIFREITFFLCCFAITYAIFYVFPPYRVSGTSMNETLDDKAFGFGFRYATPEREDIVIVNTGDKQNGTDNANFIKRVIGIPGDVIKCVWEKYDYTVTLSDGTVIPAGQQVYRVYINGVMEDAPYTNYHGGTYAPTGEWNLGQDEYFVMGDNRFGSHDSRIIGQIKRDEIMCTMKFFLWGKHSR